MRFTLDDVAAVFARTPLIADLQPGGRFLALDLHRVGGVAPVLKALLDGGHLHGDALALSGRDARRRARERAGARRRGRARGANALHATGGVVVLKGNLAPDGALIKIAGLKSSAVRGTGARLRVRGGRASPRSPSARYARRRRARHPQRRAARRARHARDARRHRAGLRPGHGREGRAAHRRPLLGRDARPDGRLHRARGGARRADRAGSRRRPHPHRRRARTLSTCSSTTPSSRAAAPRGGRARSSVLAGVLEKYAKLVGPAHLGAVTHSGPPEGDGR